MSEKILRITSMFLLFFCFFFFFCLKLIMETLCVIWPIPCFYGPPRKPLGGPIYVYMCACGALAAIVGLHEEHSGTHAASIDSTSQDIASLRPSSTSLSFLSKSLFTLFHLLRLPLFHALSSNNTVGGAALEYAGFLWAPSSGICLLFWGLLQGLNICKVHLKTSKPPPKKNNNHTLICIHKIFKA